MADPREYKAMNHRMALHFYWEEEHHIPTHVSQKQGVWASLPSVCGGEGNSSPGWSHVAWQEWAHTILPQGEATEKKNTMHYTLSFGLAQNGIPI